MPPAGSSTSSSEADEKYLVACLLWGTVDIVKEVRGESEMRILFSGEVNVTICSLSAYIWSYCMT